MKCCRFVVAGLVTAATWTTAWPAYSQTIPPAQSSAPGISVRPAASPAPQLDAGKPNTESPSVGNPVDMTEPPAGASQGTLAECISFWDAGTHMTKSEWRATCKRTLNGTDLVGEPEPPRPAIPRRGRSSTRKSGS